MVPIINETSPYDRYKSLCANRPKLNTRDLLTKRKSYLINIILINNSFPDFKVHFRVS